jgi:3-deoxy-D-arabino-heptulosonate 7-phosphate (DAHP) synthase
MIVDLAAYRAARQVPDVPIEHDPSEYRATMAALRQDYYAAHAATGDDVLAHLWAMADALADVGQSEDPKTEARYLAAAIHATLTKALRRRGR